MFPSRFKKLYPDLAQNWSSFDDNDSDVQYMGGEKKPNNRRKIKSMYGKPKKKTTVEKMLSAIGLGVPEPDPQEKWDSLSPEE